MVRQVSPLCSNHADTVRNGIEIIKKPRSNDAVIYEKYDAETVVLVYNPEQSHHVNGVKMILISGLLSVFVPTKFRLRHEFMKRCS